MFFWRSGKKFPFSRDKIMGYKNKGFWFDLANLSSRVRKICSKFSFLCFLTKNLGLGWVRIREIEKFIY